MLSSANPHTNHLGRDLDATIAKYSRGKDTSGEMTKVEVVVGLHVLGAPIGSHHFCANFLQSAMTKATSDSKKILAGLEDVQSMIKVYSTCVWTRNKDRPMC